MYLKNAANVFYLVMTIANLSAQSSLPSKASQDFNDSFSNASLVVSAAPKVIDPSCMHANNGSEIFSCTFDLLIKRVYKGPDLTGTHLNITSDIYKRDPKMKAGYLLDAQQVLLFLCPSSKGYALCDQKNVFPMSPELAQPNLESGRLALTKDLEAGLMAQDENQVRQNVLILDVAATKKDIALLHVAHDNALDLNIRLQIDRLLVKENAFEEATQDLHIYFSGNHTTEASAILPLTRDLASSSIQGLNDLVPSLLGSGKPYLLDLGLAIAESNKLTNYAPQLAAVLDQPDPIAAYHAAKILIQFGDMQGVEKPSFYRFRSDPLVRQKFTEAVRMRQGTH
jgi:hypothetical protein